MEQGVRLDMGVEKECNEARQGGHERQGWQNAARASHGISTRMVFASVGRIPAFVDRSAVVPHDILLAPIHILVRGWPVHSQERDMPAGWTPAIHGSVPRSPRVLAV